MGGRKARGESHQVSERVDCRQIHQAARQTVQLPTTVMAACSVTSHDSESALSKKCQVQAHIALTRAGNMANERVRQAFRALASAYCQINQMAATHSTTLVM